MNCIDESTSLELLDGELDPHRAGLAWQHAEHCASCGQMLAELEDETAAIRFALRLPELDLSPVVERSAELGARTWVWGGLVAAASCAWVSWEWTRVFTDLHLHPLDGWLIQLSRRGLWSFTRAVTESGIVMPMLQMMLSFLALVGLAFALRFASGRWLAPPASAARTLVVTLALGLGIMPQTAQAADVRHGERVQVAADEVVRDNLFAAGDQVTISGVVEGDCFIAAESLLIDGTVRGNLFAGTASIDLRGTVEGSLHWIGDENSIEGRIGGQSYVLGDTIRVSPEGAIVGELSSLADTLLMQGSVGRSLLMLGDSLELSGSVGRDVELTVESALLQQSARVGGNLQYRAPAPEALVVREGAQIAGETRFIERKSKADEDTGSPFFDISFYIWRLMWAASGVVIAWALFLRVPRVFDDPSQSGQSLGRVLGSGFLMLVAPPFLGGLLCATGIGLPIGMLVLLMYPVLLGVAILATGYQVGRLALRRPIVTHADFVLAVLIGVVVVSLVIPVPFIGSWVVVGSLVFGLGSIFPALERAWKSRGETGAGAGSTPQSEQPGSADEPGPTAEL